MTVLALAGIARPPLALSNDAAPGTLGFLVVFGLGVVLFFVFRSMTRHLRKVSGPGSGGGPGPGADPGGGADPAALAQVATAADETDGGGPGRKA